MSPDKDLSQSVQTNVVGLKDKAKRPAPSVLKMMETDPELKAFFRLINENGWREKASALLAERLKK